MCETVTEPFIVQGHTYHTAQCVVIITWFNILLHTIRDHLHADREQNNISKTVA